jgi:hypothetical protein
MNGDELENESRVVEEENYFVSMTDMMVGMLFIFIILLMFYVIQFRKETDRLKGANETRAIIIQDIVERLKRDNKIEGVDPDYENGIIGQYPCLDAHKSFKNRKLFRARSIVE